MSKRFGEDRDRYTAIAIARSAIAIKMSNILLIPASTKMIPFWISGRFLDARHARRSPVGMCEDV